MARFAPIEIFVPRPSDPISLSAVHDILTRIVTLALDSDPALIPAAARPLVPTYHGPIAPPIVPAHQLSPDSMTAAELIQERSPSLDTHPLPPVPVDDGGGDPSDFIVMHLAQAKRIVAGVKEAFEVEYAVEVVLADPNVEDLGRKIVESRRILGVGTTGGLGAGGGGGGGIGVLKRELSGGQGGGAGLE